jgi:hypothetical protein
MFNRKSNTPSISLYEILRFKPCNLQPVISLMIQNLLYESDITGLLFESAILRLWFCCNKYCSTKSNFATVLLRSGRYLHVY